MNGAATQGRASGFCIPASPFGVLMTARARTRSVACGRAATGLLKPGSSPGRTATLQSVIATARPHATERVHMRAVIGTPNGDARMRNPLALPCVAAPSMMLLQDLLHGR